MTIIQLKYVIEISKVGSLNQAANNLFISQSALSTAIRNLEKELGHKIFFRTNKGIQLTPFGNEFVQCIIPINMQIDQLSKMVSHPNSNFTMSISIASPNFFFISDIFAKLYNKYKLLGIIIKSYEGSINEIINYVNNNIVEVGIIRFWNCYQNIIKNQIDALDMEFYPIASLRVGVTVGPNSPLFHIKENYINKDMLEAYPLVIYHYLSDGPYSDIFERLEISTSPNRIVTSSRAMIYEILGKTDAYYLDSLYSNNYIRTKDFPFPQRTLIFSDCEIKSELGWIIKKNQNLSPITKEFINMFTDYMLKDSL